MSKRTSPFSRQHWIDKGYSIEESDYIRNSFRPIRKEYWMKKGYSEEESVKLAEKTKYENNIKGAKKSSERPKEDVYRTSHRRKEYWLEKGFTEKEAIEQISKVQSTFSLEKCIEKHGVDVGYKKWKSRQEKWQNTLNSKTEEEKKEINKKKWPHKLQSTVEETVEYFKKRGITLFGSMESLICNIEQDLKINPNKKYFPVEKYAKTISKTQLLLLNETIESIQPFISHLFIDIKFLNIRGNKQCYNKWTKLGLLRSSFEIYFYDMIMQLYPDVNIKLDKRYPNSSFRYDFCLDDKIFIEICPQYDTNEPYRMKMDKKCKLFNCILLKNVMEIDQYIKTYINENNNR